MSNNYRNTGRDSEGQPIRFDTVGANVWVPSFMAGALSVAVVAVALALLVYGLGRRQFSADVDLLVKTVENFANWGWSK